jgi:hypothetical protein
MRHPHKLDITRPPWSLESGDRTSTNVIASSGIRVARCDFDGLPTHPECRANAALIASAPQLHARIVRLLEYLESIRALKAITGLTIDEEIRETRRVLYVAKGLTGKVQAV